MTEAIFCLEFHAPLIALGVSLLEHGTWKSLLWEQKQWRQLLWHRMDKTLHHCRQEKCELLPPNRKLPQTKPEAKHRSKKIQERQAREMELALGLRARKRSHLVLLSQKHPKSLQLQVKALPRKVLPRNKLYCVIPLKYSNQCNM